MASTHFVIGNVFPPSLEPELNFRALLPERVRNAVFPCENIDALSFHGFSFPLKISVYRWTPGGPGPCCKGTAVRRSLPQAAVSASPEWSLDSVGLAYHSASSLPSCTVSPDRIACRYNQNAGFHLCFHPLSARGPTARFYKSFLRNVTSGSLSGLGLRQRRHTKQASSATRTTLPRP